MRKSLLIFIIIIIFIGGYIMFDWYMRSVFSIVAQEQCTKIMSNCLNDAAYEIISEGISYEDLITIKQDQMGNIVLVQSDTMKINMLGSRVSSRAEEILEEKENSGVSIPFGYLIGGQMMSDKLPNMTIHFRQIGNAASEFYSEFKSAGINQTVHKVNMKLTVQALMQIPNYNQRITVEVTLPVCETIIVGTVPQDYMNWFRDNQ